MVNYYTAQKKWGTYIWITLIVPYIFSVIFTSSVDNDISIIVFS